MEKNRGFGERLREAIQKAGLTQRRVSQILGISKNTMTNYVRGITEPKGETLVKLASLLNVDPEWLVTGNESVPRNEFFGIRLKEAIIKAGFTQKRLAELLGISQDTMTNYVKGATQPKGETLVKLASLLNVDPEWLVTGVEPAGRKTEAGFARRFADCLKKSGLDPPGLAQLAGVDQAVVEAALAGRLPDAVTLCRLARALGTTVEWLVTGEGPGYPAPEKRTGEPDAARIMAAVAALEKEELESYLKGEMSPERFMYRISELSGLAPPAVESLIQRMGRTNRPENKEEAAASDLSEEAEILLRFFSELTPKEKKDLLTRATYYYARKVAPDKSGVSGEK
jgi:transcriptional regulator with XRE-family HTH domain